MGFDNVNVNVSGPVQPTSTYKTKVLKGNHSFASQVTEPNIKYVIKHDFDLGGETVTILEGCVLEFDGGSLSNGKCISNKTVIFDKNKGNAVFCGIFYNANKEAFGYDGNSTRILKSNIESVDTRRNDSVPQGIVVNEEYVFLFATDSNNTPSVILYDRYYNYIGQANVINYNSHVNDATLMDDKILLANSSLNGIASVDVNDIINAVNNGQDLTFTSLEIEENSKIADIDYDSSISELAVYNSDSNYISIYDKNLQLLRTFHSSFYDDIAEELGYRVLRPSIIYKKGVVYQFVGTSRYGNKQVSPFLCGAIDTYSGDYYKYCYVNSTVYQYEQEGACKSPDGDYIYIVANAVIAGNNATVFNKVSVDEFEIGITKNNQTDLADEDDLEYVYVVPETNIDYIPDGTSDKPYNRLVHALSRAMGSTTTIRLSNGTYNIPKIVLTGTNTRIEGANVSNTIINTQKFTLQRASTCYLSAISFNISDTFLIKQNSNLSINTIEVNKTVEIDTSTAYFNSIKIKDIDCAFTLRYCQIYLWRNVVLKNVESLFDVVSNYSFINTNHILSGVKWDDNGVTKNLYESSILLRKTNNSLSFNCIQETDVSVFHRYVNYLKQYANSGNNGGIQIICLNDGVNTYYGAITKGQYLYLKGSIIRPNGMLLETKSFGETSIRPEGTGADGGTLDSNTDIGFSFFDTTLGKPIYVKAIGDDGTVTWVDATGATV